MNFKRPEHTKIAEFLVSMNRDLLVASQSFFGGGTAIVMKHDEYRQSLDVDFLCANADGYREVRSAFFSHGIHAVLPPEAKLLRDIQANSYGVRGLVDYKGQQIKFEFVREARIELEGAIDPDLRVPTLSAADMFAEKLLANSDRGLDSSVGYRDMLDIGALLDAHSRIPESAVAKAMSAYGDDVPRKMASVLNTLQDTNKLRAAATKLEMDNEQAISFVSALRTEGERIWPQAGIAPDKIADDECEPYIGPGV